MDIKIVSLNMDHLPPSGAAASSVAATSVPSAAAASPPSTAVPSAGAAPSAGMVAFCSAPYPYTDSLIAHASSTEYSLILRSVSLKTW